MTKRYLRDPIFIMSSERSGSNLLRVLLGNHSHIAAPRALQLLATFRNSIPRYGPLDRKENMRMLFEDCLSLANHPYHAWNVSFDFETFYAVYAPYDFLSLFNSMYREYAHCTRRQRFVCKEINVFEFAEQLAGYYDTPRFLYLHRDPRDYAASWKKFSFGPATTYGAARRWADEQRSCIAVRERLGMNVLTLSYEQLILNTEQVMRDVLTFVEEPYESSCCALQPGENKDVAWNPMWKNLNQPIDRKNYNTYHRTLSRSAIEMIETVAQEPMKGLGYTFDTKAEWKAGNLFFLQESILSRIAQFRKRYVPEKGLRLLCERKRLVQTILHNRNRGC